LGGVNYPASELVAMMEASRRSLLRVTQPEAVGIAVEGLGKVNSVKFNCGCLPPRCAADAGVLLKLASPASPVLDPDHVSSTEVWKTLWINHCCATEVAESSLNFRRNPAIAQKLGSLSY
jgi:hypothetical protein